jgi:hypothetical protein
MLDILVLISVAERQNLLPLPSASFVLCAMPEENRDWLGFVKNSMELRKLIDGIIDTQLHSMT